MFILKWSWNIKGKVFRINKQITSPEVRLISEKGDQLGILKIDEAMKIAESKELDLVEIHYNDQIPVCKLLNYRKFIFEKKKKRKELQKKVKKVLLKEIKLRPKISEHDYKFKLNHILSFLEKGNKIKISILFRGRELAHVNLGKKILDQIKADLQGKILIEKEPKLEGRQMIMYINRIKK